MGCKHTIRTKTGELKDLSLTPVQAIRHHCLECNGWDNPVKVDCLGKYCALYPYRTGKNKAKKGIGVVKNLQK